MAVANARKKGDLGSNPQPILIHRNMQLTKKMTYDSPSGSIEQRFQLYSIIGCLHDEANMKEMY